MSSTIRVYSMMVQNTRLCRYHAFLKYFHCTSLLDDNTSSEAHPNNGKTPNVHFEFPNNIDIDVI